MARRYLDGVVLIDDATILAGLRFALERLQAGRRAGRRRGPRGGARRARSRSATASGWRSSCPAATSRSDRLGELLGRCRERFPGRPVERRGAARTGRRRGDRRARRSRRRRRVDTSTRGARRHRDRPGRRCRAARPRRSSRRSNADPRGPHTRDAAGRVDAAAHRRQLRPADALDAGDAAGVVLHRGRAPRDVGAAGARRPGRSIVTDACPAPSSKPRGARPDLRAWERFLLFIAVIGVIVATVEAGHGGRRCSERGWSVARSRSARRSPGHAWCSGERSPPRSSWASRCSSRQDWIVGWSSGRRRTSAATPTVIVTLVVTALVGAPFAYVLAGVVLGDVRADRGAAPVVPRVQRPRRSPRSWSRCSRSWPSCSSCSGVGVGLDLAFRVFDAARPRAGLRRGSGCWSSRSGSSSGCSRSAR